MDIAHTETLERIARVLAGLNLSANANGQARSAGEAVDEAWRSHLGDAAAILHALREPDAQMAAVGDVDTWTRMVRAALGEAAPLAEAAGKGTGEIYQKPWG
jgi:hypothetical protein